MKMSLYVQPERQKGNIYFINPEQRMKMSWCKIISKQRSLDQSGESCDVVCPKNNKNYDSIRSDKKKTCLD